MNSRRWRFSVYLLVALLSVLLISKSRTVPERKGAAFLRYTTGSLVIKVAGSDGADGVYRIIDGENGVCVKNMTIRGVSYAFKSDNSGNLKLNNGHVVELKGKYLQTSAQRMSAVELILLGVPLDPAVMSADDWDSLPGVGAGLAASIILYSQKNGGIASVEELANLSGVGEGKLKRIRAYFR